MIPTFGGGLLTNSTVRTAIQQNEVARLADFYVTTASPAPRARAFMDNPGIYAARGRDQRRVQQLQRPADRSAPPVPQRHRRPGELHVGHTPRPTRPGTAQSRLEPFLDNARPELDVSRSEFHVTHVVNANLILDLPFGEGRRWLNQGGVANAIFGGWQTSAIIHWQKGVADLAHSARGTFNRAGRSGTMTAVTSLTQEQLNKLFKVSKAANGNIYWIDPDVIDPATGRAVGADNLNNTAGFAGQVFFNPMAGEVGNLPILQFDRPAVASFDAAIAKQFTFATASASRSKGELLNVFNSVCFNAGDYDINSTTFGRITGVAVGRAGRAVDGRIGSRLQAGSGVGIARLPRRGSNRPRPGFGELAGFGYRDSESGFPDYGRRLRAPPFCSSRTGSCLNVLTANTLHSRVSARLRGSGTDSHAV